MDDDEITDETPFDEAELATEEEIQQRKDDRARILGFYPQCEVAYNALLPYAEKLDKESLDMWNDVKTNLGRAISLRELRPGYVMWTGKLVKFINLYGYKFSKEDHIMMINLLFDVLNLCDLDPWLINRTASTLNVLLRKRKLLEPCDLEIKWRPLYELYERLFYNPYEPLGMIHYPNPLENTIRSLIRNSRPYFGLEATQEMLEEWRPLMCPFDVTMSKAMGYCEMFLPTFNCQHVADQTYQLWFLEIMAFWQANSNSALFEPNIFSLMCRLAEDTAGYFDWGPYIPYFMTRIHQSFELPVTYKNIQPTKKAALDKSAAVKWILAAMGSNPEIFDNLEQMFNSLESYFHSANFGRHSPKITDFLVKLVNGFVDKIHKERYLRKRPWGCVIPEDKKATDEQITRFVKILMPVCLTGMFFKAGLNYFSKVLQMLTFLRPEITIPPIVEKVFVAIDTLTEPHKLTTCMLSVTAMARSVVQPGSFCKEAATNVIPLLMATLPAIDPNDMNKSLVAFQLISTYCMIVPLVDCSNANQFYNDLTDEETLICSQTAQFEDFIAEFLDKCFALIESSSLEQTREEVSLSDHRNSIEETMKDVGMASAFNVIINNCSEHLYGIALKKVQSFIRGRILETKIAGKIAASLCRCLVWSRPEKGLPAFVPQACATISDLLTEDSIEHENLIDDELKFNLLILSECVRTRGRHLLPYLDSIKAILRKSLRMKSRDGRMAASILLKNLLRSMTITFSEEYRSCPEGPDLPISESLPIRNWGKPGNIHSLQIKWSIPNSEELNAAQELIDELLGKEIESIDSLVKGELDLNKDQLQNSLYIIYHTIHGSGSCVPQVDETDGPALIDSVTNLQPFSFIVHNEPASLTLKGQNLRKAIVDTMEYLQKFLLSKRSDDSKSLFLVISIYEMALTHHGISRNELKNHKSSFHMGKSNLDNKLKGACRTIRPLLIDRTVIQHETRLLERYKTKFTSTHSKVLASLVDMATSEYPNVRLKAQELILFLTSNFAYSYKLLVGPIVKLLDEKNTEEEVSHEAFKGTLYVLLGSKEKTILTKHDWTTIYQLWPALVLSRHSEKPSVANLLDHIFVTLQSFSETFALNLRVPDSVVKAGFGIIPHQAAQPSEADLQNGLVRNEQKNKTNLDTYLKLIEKLCQEIESKKLHWRHNNMALGMLTILTRHDVPLPPRAVKIMVNNLIDDNLLVRKCSIHAIGCILKQNKRPHVKITLEGLDDPKVPGDRDENRWLCYDPDNVPTNEAAWDSPRFVHKTHFGYYTWPKTMQVYAPSDQQPKLNRSIDELSPAEKEIFSFFSSEPKVAQLVKFLSLEEQKGRDIFNARRFFTFKGLFRNFGDSFLPVLRPHLEALVDSDQESSHRCAAEMIAGLIRGMKHWPWKMTSDTWAWLQPLLRKIVSKITVESFADWGTCFATASESRDPTRIHWLLDILMEEPIQSKGSFHDCSRLYALQGALSQQEWRIPTLMNKLLLDLKPFLTHSFMNVRDRLGSVITNIFLIDIDFSHFPNHPKGNIGGNQRNPKMADFIGQILPSLEILCLDDNDTSSGDHTPINSESVLTPDQPVGMPMPRMPPPHERMSIPPPPEMMARMRMPPPEMMARMRMPPPELLAKMGMPGNPGMMMRLPPPSMMARMRIPLVEGALGGMPLPMDTFGAPPDVKWDPIKEEKQNATRLLQSVCKCIGGCLVRDTRGIRAEYFKLLPMLCIHESNELEPYLAQDCAVTLGYIAQAHLPMQVIPSCLEAIELVAKSSSWKARASVLELLQVTVFLNMPSLLSQRVWVHQVMDVVQSCLIDERVEVRSKAGQVLGGLLHCAFIDKERQEGLLKSFYAKVRRKKRRKSSAEAGYSPEEIVSMHSGVLGLCSFVNAFPYDVPHFMPEVLMVLSAHLHDPQPIPITIKKTLQDFKRTHQDNWQEHKLKFSDDQLAVLTDLLVSPSYYA